MRRSNFGSGMLQRTKDIRSKRATGMNYDLVAPVGAGDDLVSNVGNSVVGNADPDELAGESSVGEDDRTCADCLCQCVCSPQQRRPGVIDDFYNPESVVVQR